MSSKFNNEMRSVLYNLRCRTLKNFKDNFHNAYQVDFNCDLCQKEVDSQEHTLKCHILRNHITINDGLKYDHIFGSLEQQETITFTMF